MEEHAAYIARVTLQCVHLPVLVARESPELDSFVISSRGKDLHGGVEGDPVDAFLVAVEDVFHFDFCASNNLRWSRTTLLHRELFQLEEVPDSDSLIETATRDEGVFRVELGTHHIVRMSCKDS